MERLSVRYASWDLSHVTLVDPHDNNALLCTLYPQDKSANASALRRVLEPQKNTNLPSVPESATAPLLKDLMAQYAATGLPMSFIPKGDEE